MPFSNIEDAVEYFFNLSDDEDEESTLIDIVLEPPDDGAESDVDDPNKDVVDVDGNKNQITCTFT